MKIAWYTDTHFGLSGAFSTPSSSGYTTRLDETLDLHKWIAQKIKDIEPDLTIHGGDIFKPQVTLHGSEVSAASRGTGAVVKASNQHITLLGNHDYISRDTKVTAIDWLNELEGSKIIKTIDFMHLDDDTILVFCPFVYDYGHAMNKISDMIEGYDNIFFFGHAEIGGALNSTVVDLGTGETQNHYSTSGNSIPTDYLKEFTLSFNGHHHIPQRPEENVILTGSIQQFTVTEFSEKPRGIYVIDTDDGSFEIIENNITPDIVRVENNLDKLEEIGKNTYVIFYYDPKKFDKEDIKPKLEKFKGSKLRQLSPEKFKPITNVEIKSKDEDHEGIYNEYLETVDFGSKDLEKEVKEKGKKKIKEAESEI